MSSQLSQSLPSALRRPAPRWGSLRLVALDRLTRAGRAIWQALETYGERRARRELLALAERWKDVNPTLARELRSYARGGSSY